MLNFNCVTGSFFPEHNFRRWANLTSIFLVIPFVLEQQAWFRVCVVLVVPITFRFIIPLTWCHHRLITSSWNLSTIESWSSSTFRALTGYQSNSWWEIPSLSLDNFYYHQKHPWLPFITNLTTLWIQLALQLVLCSALKYYYPFLSRMLWGLLHLLEILGMMTPLTITILPWSLCCF